MTTSDLISVIVPVYNCEKYISQALDSIVNQTYDYDGSTDKSPAICDKYSIDSRVRAFHRPNSGLSATRQFGIDNDDYIAADYIEKLYTTIKKIMRISLRVVSIVYQIKQDKSGMYMTKELLSSNFWKIFKDFILTDSWNKMHRTQFVRDTKVRYELPNTYIGQDMWLELRLALHCPVYCTYRESMLFHRKHQGGMMDRKSTHWQAGFKITTERLIEDSRLLGLSLKKQLTSVYYGMIGILVLNIFFCGGCIKKTHTKLQALVTRNKRFIAKNKGYIDTNKCFKAIKMSKYLCHYLSSAVPF